MEAGFYVIGIFTAGIFCFWFFVLANRKFGMSKQLAALIFGGVFLLSAAFSGYKLTDAYGINDQAFSQAMQENYSLQGQNIFGGVYYKGFRKKKKVSLRVLKDKEKFNLQLFSEFKTDFYFAASDGLPSVKNTPKIKEFTALKAPLDKVRVFASADTEKSRIESAAAEITFFTNSGLTVYLEGERAFVSGETDELRPEIVEEWFKALTQLSEKLKD